MRSLRTVSLFAGLSEEVLARIEHRCRWYSRETGEMVIGQNDESKDIYFLVEGRARVVIYAATGKVVAFREIGRGDFFGEMAAIDGRPRSASIEALEHCRLAAMDQTTLLNTLDSAPTVTRALLLHLVTQVRVLTGRVYEFSTLAVANRIHAELLRLARVCEKPDGSALLDPAPRQSAIAEHISTHREAVAREFAHLNRLGIIERKGSALLINDLARLGRMVSEATGE
jgi:CRP-like cAMP-binding protein